MIGLVVAIKTSVSIGLRRANRIRYKEVVVIGNPDFVEDS